MSLLHYFILFVAVLFGGALAFKFKSQNRRFLQLILSFVGAYILGIIVLHLIPDAYSDGKQAIGLWVLGGFFIQLVLEQLSMGVEHGHIHDHHHTSKPLFALQVMLGLSVHAFIEGLPLSMFADTRALFYGVIMHKAPEAFALALLLIMSHFDKKTVWGCIVFFSMMSPLGAFLTQYAHFQEGTLHCIIALVIGSLLHISTTILFEIDNTDEHRISWSKIGAIAAGVGVSLLTLL
jgi:zinc transporter ZupT